MLQRLTTSGLAAAALLLTPLAAEAGSATADAADAVEAVEAVDAAHAAAEELPTSSPKAGEHKVKRKGTKKKREKRPGVRKLSDTSRIKRRPVYFGAGFGAGVSTLSNAPKWGALAGSFSLRLGAAIKDQWLVGAQASFMAQFHKWAENEPTGAILSNAMADFTAYPLAHIPWAFSAGVGWGSAGTVDRRADVQGTPIPVSKSGNGVAWTAGTSWDFFPGRGTNLGVQIRYEGTQSKNIGVDHGAMFVLWTTLH